MNLGHTLFSPNGRSTQNEYWLGVLIVVLGNLFLAPLPVVGAIFWIGLIYVGAVVSAKRLHDAGKTGWIHLIPWVISLSLMGFGVVAAGGAALAPVLDMVGKPGGWEMLESGDLTPQAHGPAGQRRIAGGGRPAALLVALCVDLGGVHHLGGRSEP
jgi:hypothetical protein